MAIAGDPAVENPMYLAIRFDLTRGFSARMPTSISNGLGKEFGVIVGFTKWRWHMHEYLTAQIPLITQLGIHEQRCPVGADRHDTHARCR